MMNQENNTNKPNEVTVKDLINLFKRGIVYVKNKWPTLLTITVMGSVVGLSYALLKKNTYSAVCTFVLEDSNKGSALGEYAGLASLAGISLGGSGGGIFEGDNIIELYKSRKMIEKTLLTEIIIDGRKQSLIERYITHNNLRDKWRKKGLLGNVVFTGSADVFNRQQDSIISDLVNLFNKKVLNVSKPDKKLSIINVNVVSDDELFAKEFTDKLVANVNDFYISTKTKKAYQNVLILKKEADSIRVMLNSSLNGVASAVDATPNANPLQQVLRVASQKKQIDVQASSAIYSEVSKNLELAKISLRQEAPLIQIIDSPTLPLSTDKIGGVKGAVIGSILGFFLSVTLVVTKKIYSNIINS